MQMSIQEIKNELKTYLETVINSPHKISVTENLLETGIDSLTIMRLLSGWIKKGYKVSFGDFIKNPTIQLWAEILAESKEDKKEQIIKKVISDREPFDLTDVQYAYWIGRNESQYLGGIGCHGYLEVEAKNIDREQLQKSWQVVLEAHPMLRACYTDDGKQYVLDKAYSDRIVYNDLRNYSDTGKKKYLENHRKKLSHRLLKIEKGQVTELQVSQLTDEKFILHFDIDLLVCDVQSFQIILRDLARYYLYHQAPEIDYDWNFAQYLHDTNLREVQTLEADQKFWQDKLASMPEAPKLPVNRNIENIQKPRFIRNSWKFSIEEWDLLKEECSKYGVTPAMALLSAYARVVDKWSVNKRFLMNLPMFNRNASESVENVVADFTSLLLLEMDFTEKRSFLEDVSLIQKNFHENVDHIRYSGVKVLRDLQKHTNREIVAPVVFSCNIGSPLLSEEFLNAFGDISYMISQTPQVWLDFQAFNTTDGLLIIWDSVEQVFPEDMLEQMFDVFIEQIQQVVQKGFKSERTPLSAGEKRRLEVLGKVGDYKALENTLHYAFFKQAELSPDMPAIINGDSGSCFSYGETAKNARSIAAGVVDKVWTRQLIGILMERGEKQVTAAMGILAAGMGFVPLSKKQPLKRLSEIISSSSMKYVIVDAESKEQFKELPVVVLVYEELIKYMPVTSIQQVAGEDTAYVIFTSGTTGVPKGVEMAHAAAANTVADVNKRCNANAGDVFFNVSSFDFDLSIYDIFGSLAVGASLVCIKQKSWRNADKWLQLVQQFNITIWNSVPTLFKMLLAEAESKQVTCNSLRYVLLSGDWIDLDIPERLGHLASEAKLLAMGGATEAAIWSNYMLVEGQIPDNWVSIPYGKPLIGQHYRIVNQKHQDCPDYAVGELWIGGVGVAKGYLGDEKLTSEKFILEYNSRWYRTGDLGRFWRDDTIEFLGRKDKQVKVRGHRIELGEIESALNKVSGIEKCVVSVTDVFEHKKLIAYLKTGKEAERLGSATVNAPFLSGILNQFDMDVVAPEQIKALKEEGAVQNSFAVKTMRKWIEKVKNTKILPCFQPLIELWYRRVKSIDELSSSQNRDSLNNFIKPFEKNLLKLLSGKYTARDIVLDEQFISAESLLSSSVKGEIVHVAFISALMKIKRSTAAPLRVLEIGASRPAETINYMDIFQEDQYVVADESQFYIQKMKEQIPDKEIEYRIISLDEMMLEVKPEFDVIIANQVIHRAANIPDALLVLQNMLKNNGFLVVAEPVKEEPLAEISTIFLRKDYTDKRAGSLHMLYDQENWEEVVKAQGFESYFDKSILSETQMSIFILQNPAFENVILDAQWLREQLKVHLPAYMIPEFFMFLKAFPVTANGKLDRLRLPHPNKDAVNRSDEIEKLSDSEVQLISLWEKILNVRTGKNDSYFMLGGDSLLATILRNSIQETFGVQFSLETIFAKPVLADMAAHIDTLPRNNSDSGKTIFRVHDENDYEPFPLTEIQQSYLIGRSGAFALGDVSSHCYFEMETDALEPQIIEAAWNKLIQVHPMMRAVICEDNLNQKVLEQVPRYQLDIVKLEEKTADEKEEILVGLREKMANQLFDPHIWPAYDIRYVQIDDNSGRILISFDNLFFDGWSMFRIFMQWKQLYVNPDLNIDTGDITFREYVLSLQSIKRSKSYQKDLEYWQQKLPEIHKAPELNVTLNKAVDSKFVRYQRKIDNITWAAIKKSIKKHEMTEPAFLMSLYVEVLVRYSKHQKFSLNLTRFNRLPISEDINKTIGDFTILTILSLDLTAGKTFAERAYTLQRVLWSDLAHSNVNGIEVERMLNQDGKTVVTMPVVFTSGLGINAGHPGGTEPYLGKIGYGLSQTPQVWLDMQVYDDVTGLSVSLDAVEGIFPTGMVEDMFKGFESLLLKFAENEMSWDCERSNLLEVNNTALICDINQTDRAVSEKTLVSLFKTANEKYPNQIGVIQEGVSLTYMQLEKTVRKLSTLLIAKKVKRQSPIAIMLKKGIGQVIAATGIMMCGGIYLPLNVDHPWERNLLIMRNAGVETIVVEDDSELLVNEKDNFEIVKLADSEKVVPKDREVLAVHQPKVNDIAYIIYTSGTTGQPKGVAIEHKSAVNTIMEINHLIGANEDDRILALSQLNFDLSVYDIFGMFECGGTIVMPNHNQAIEPEHWDELVKRHEITIWNSVPPLLKMYTTYLQEHQESSVSKILLSGDWIPVDIKEQVNKRLGNCEIYGLGGATEASIWSNWYLISEKDADRQSIPYGRPLANQKMYVLNDVLDDVPNNVPGNLYIGGCGLANCYWNDAERTAESFIFHPQKEERLYRTGDMAMYSSEGFLIFLGREDGQIKINGYRVEIGEIETAINKLHGVTDCAVVFNKQLHAFIGCSDEIEEMMIKEKLQESLPDYMHPQYLHITDILPLTANGKVDRKLLMQKCLIIGEGELQAGPETENEEIMTQIWEQLLKQKPVYIYDDFFALGGNSLKAVQMINEIKREMHIELSLKEIFDHANIRKISEHIETLQEGQVEGTI